MEAYYRKYAAFTEQDEYFMHICFMGEFEMNEIAERVLNDTNTLNTVMQNIYYR